MEHRHVIVEKPKEVNFTGNPVMCPRPARLRCSCHPLILFFSLITSKWKKIIWDQLANSLCHSAQLSPQLFFVVVVTATRLHHKFTRSGRAKRGGSIDRHRSQPNGLNGYVIVHIASYQGLHLDLACLKLFRVIKAQIFEVLPFNLFPMTLDIVM